MPAGTFSLEYFQSVSKFFSMCVNCSYTKPFNFEPDPMSLALIMFIKGLYWEDANYKFCVHCQSGHEQWVVAPMRDHSTGRAAMPCKVWVRCQTTYLYIQYMALLVLEEYCRLELVSFFQLCIYFGPCTWELWHVLGVLLTVRGYFVIVYLS